MSLEFAPHDKIGSFEQRMGWTAHWYSLLGGDFHYGFHITASVDLDEKQRVAVWVAEPEHRGHRADEFNRTDSNRSRRADACNLGVDVDAARLHLRVRGVDVVGVEDDPGLHPGRVSLPRRHEGDTRCPTRRVDLYPAVAVAPENVVAPLEPQRLVERERPILVGRWDQHQLDLTDAVCRDTHFRSPLVSEF